MTRFLLALFAAFAVAAPAHAGGKGKGKGEDKQGEADSALLMVTPNLITPVVRQGRLANYLFVTIQVELSAKADLIKTRDRAHFLRDALLRASHRADLADPANDRALNQAAALPLFRQATLEALGAGNVKAVTILSVDSLKRG